jgi:RNA polymerase sigma factor for flagellar operon FliA
MVEFIPLARSVAARHTRRGSLDWQDATQDALLIVPKAVESWREDGGASLKTWVSLRMHGAVVDALRLRSYVSRYAATNHADDWRGRQPTSLDLTVTHRSTGESGQNTTVGDQQADPADAYLDLEDEDWRTWKLALLREAVTQIPPHQRQVLEMYYWGGMTQAAVGAALGVTESRICQIVKAGQHSLRARIGPRILAALAA